MKRILFAGALPFLFATASFDSQAQDPANHAAAVAARQETEERYQRMSADLEALQAANVSLQKRLAALTEELQGVREEISRNQNGQTKMASQEDIKYLAEKLREVDKKRESGDEQILAEVRKLLGTLAAAPPAGKPVKKEKPDGAGKPDRANDAPAQKAAVEEGYWYVVKERDTLSTIAQDYREQGVKVTAKQIQEANPKLDPLKLLPGKTKIWIPHPQP